MDIRKGDTVRVKAPGMFEGQEFQIVDVQERRHGTSVYVDYRVTTTGGDGMPCPAWFSADEIEPV